MAHVLGDGVLVERDGVPDERLVERRHDLGMGGGSGKGGRAQSIASGYVVVPHVRRVRFDREPMGATSESTVRSVLRARGVISPRSMWRLAGRRAGRGREGVAGVTTNNNDPW